MTNDTASHNLKGKARRMPIELRIHAFLPFSLANGPGRRAVIWVQGCSLGCPGCYNPQTHPFTGGKLVSVDDLFEYIVTLGNSIEGITVSGGEPLEQLVPLTNLLRRIKTETSLSVILFTGFTWEEVVRMGKEKRRDSQPTTHSDELPEILHYVDVLIAGRYDQTQRLASDLRGSANKTIHFLTNRYTQADLQAVPDAEVIISPNGEIAVSGIEIVRL